MAMLRGMRKTETTETEMEIETEIGTIGETGTEIEIEIEIEEGIEGTEETGGPEEIGRGETGVGGIVVALGADVIAAALAPGIVAASKTVKGSCLALSSFHVPRSLFFDSLLSSGKRREVGARARAVEEQIYTDMASIPPARR